MTHFTKGRWLSAIATTFLFTTTVRAVAADSAKTTPPATIRSNAILVMDESNDRTLLAKRANQAAPIASITKLMTALVVLEAEQPMDEMLPIRLERSNNTSGTASRLPVGKKLSRADLLHLALMSSENRAAYTLASHYPGGLPAALAAMNAKAAELGMRSSHFDDPTGLSSNNVASAADLVKLVDAASANETINRYSTDHEHSVLLAGRRVEFRNTNSLVANPTWDIVLQKTGYISAAGRCLVMKTVIEGRTIVMVLLDSFGKYTRVADAKRIRDWLVAHIKATTAPA